MRSIRKALLAAGRRSGLNATARAFASRRLLIVGYHGVSEAANRSSDPMGVHIPVGLFERQIRELLRYYRPVSLGEVVEHFHRGATLPARALLVTFDDGYRNVLSIALPVMKRFRVLFAVFVVAQNTETGRVLWQSEFSERYATNPKFFELREQLLGLSYWERRQWLSDKVSKTEQPRCRNYELLNWQELAELAGTREIDVAIGSHGLSHEPLTTFDHAGARAELAESRTLIAQRLGLPVEAIAYPFGVWSPNIRDIAREAGYSIAITTEARHTRPNDDRLALPRFPIGPGDEPSDLVTKLSGWVECVAHLRI